jgi:hypothetical protein
MVFRSRAECCNCWHRRRRSPSLAWADCTDLLTGRESCRRCYPSARRALPLRPHFSQGAGKMNFRTVLAALIILASITAGGCTYRDPFYRCDNRRSLADWFDEYGPLGCSCNHGNCKCNACGCNR